MPAHRTYTWEYRAPRDKPAESALLQATCLWVLERACETRPQFFSAPRITGSAFAILQFGITVSSKDQWRVQWRARKLLAEIQHATSVPLTLVSEVQALRPPPHRHPNRGARWRARQSPSSSRTDSPSSPV